MNQQLAVAGSLASLPPSPALQPALSVPTAAPPGQLSTPAPYLDASDELLFDPDPVDALPKFKADVGGVPLEELAQRIPTTRTTTTDLRRTVIDLEAGKERSAQAGGGGDWMQWILPVAAAIIVILCGVLLYMLTSGRTTSASSSPYDSLGLAPGLGGSTSGYGF